MPVIEDKKKTTERGWLVMPAWFKKKKNQEAYQDAGFYIVKRMAVITFTDLSSKKISSDGGTNVIVVVGSFFSVHHERQWLLLIGT